MSQPIMFELMLNDVVFSPGSVIVNYSTSYDASYVLQDADAASNITDYIATVAFPSLWSTSLGDGTIDTEYLNTTAMDELFAAGGKRFHISLSCVQGILVKILQITH